MAWTIQDLGALGEFISSLAVLITLILLVAQVRQTKQAIRDNSYILSAQLIYETFDLAATSEYLSRANAKDHAGQTLTADEELALINYWRSLIRRAEAFHYQSHRSLVSADRLAQFGERLARTHDASARFREAWARDLPTMTEDFRVWAESYFAEQSTAQS